jgi:ABC-type transport system substrate-binding protein
MTLGRRRVALGVALSPIAARLACAAPGDAAAGKKVLRYAFRVAESGFDPARIDDQYSRTITGHIFEGLYGYDPLARPAKIRPLTAAAMPEVTDEFRVWTMRLRPGIFFASDPAFKGKRRELVAEDYVYSFKRFADPALKSPTWTSLEDTKIVGLAELRKALLALKQPFDYDRPIEGLRALDRYTLQIRLREPEPRLLETLAGGDVYGAVAREVVERYQDDIPAHPVGTGPFKLVQWRRSSFTALERNPEFRELLYEAEPAPDDTEGQALLARFKGRRLPMVDRVEVSIIEEPQPRWLTFLKQGSDLIEEVPPDFIDRAMPGGRVAPNLARQGVRGWRVLRSDAVFSFFNMDDPLVGGYTPEKVALRRAISLGIDLEREIRLVRRSQALPAQSPALPHTYAYAPRFKSENSEYSVPKAKALLDMYGYVDRDGDGWREQPDGSPLVLRRATQPDPMNRQFDEQWQRNMKAIGLRIEFSSAKFQENLKAARAGKLMFWALSAAGAGFDSQSTFDWYHSAQIGGQNFARFSLPAMDSLVDRIKSLPNGPERLALFEQAKRLAAAYVPYKFHVHRFFNDMAQPWVVGYRRPLFWLDFWQYVDIDLSLLPAR